MSIATLKKKTLAKYNNLSVGQKQFSINGTTRNQGYIGQTSLSRSLIHTPLKNAVPRGHGGCCSTPQPIIKASEIYSLEDNTVVKPSVLSTKGLLATRYRWINRPFPNAVVKNLSSINDQTDYIARLKKKTLGDIDKYCPPPVAGKNVGKKVCSSAALKTAKGFSIFSKPKLNCDVAKDMETKSQTKYVMTIQDKCALFDKYKVVSPLKRTPLIGSN
jgi:hypothetical protein